jgi:hypothetical protein
MIIAISYFPRGYFLLNLAFYLIIPVISSGQTSLEFLIKKPKKPEICGEWHVIISKDQIADSKINCGQIVDHCFFPDSLGIWQAWVQIRDTKKGRIFTRWELNGDSIYNQWIYHGVCWEADQSAGESIGTSIDKNVIQAPYVLQDKDKYLLVYSGGPIDSSDHIRQICLAFSTDGINFVRNRNSKNFSRIAVGPNHSADAHLVKYNGEYLLYIGAQNFENKDSKAAVTLRKSKNLTSWSKYNVVHSGGISGNHSHSSQSPFILFLDGFFYLFVQGWSGANRTAVYRSSSPEYFGRKDEKLITVLNASAAEIFYYKNKWYISSLIVEDGSYSGVKIAPIKWKEGE